MCGDDAFTPCPRCARSTRTVGRGTCAECWQAKTEDGESAFVPGAPRTTPLLGLFDDIPEWIWIALAVALFVGILRGVVYLI